MCGICGYIAGERIADRQLCIMNDSMKHRGPDDSGYIQICQSGYYAGLAQRRLSILDLSKLGHQPMYSGTGQNIIVYNGEIYNFRELRKKLVKSGMTFRSECDTEVILAAYEAYGKECVNYFNGMFAFAVFDRKKNSLFLARDRMGKKPFYYYYNKNRRTFVFASALQPVMKFPGFPKIISKKALYYFFYYGYICEPLSIFENVYKLEPGCTAELCLSDFTLKRSRYWDVYGAYQNGVKERIENYPQARASLKKCLEGAVKRRMISDVPLGTFLSGGIDSALVTAAAQSVSEKTIHTYSIGFYDKKFDESVYAKEISSCLGTNHHCFVVSEEDMIALADDLPKYYDEPFSDSSQLPSMLVSKMAKQEITVALTGDGGDELFCGYEGYDNILKVSRYKKIAKPFYPVSKLKMVQEIFPSRVLSVLNEAYDDSCQWTSAALKKTADNLLLVKQNEIRYDESWLNQNINIQVRRMLMDMKTYLPGDILHKVDRASMKYSLETRCPLLDYQVVELSFRIPHEYKYKDGDKKFILKDIVYDYVPKKLLDRPKKGFSVPLKKILQTEKALEMIEAYSSEDFLKRQGLFDCAYVNTLKEAVFGNESKYSHSSAGHAVNVLWSFYVFQKWYAYYIAE